MTTQYPEETLDKREDDGTMPESRKALEDAIVGHRIVSVRKGNTRYTVIGSREAVDLVLTLDNGKEVELIANADCCAVTYVEKFFLDPASVDHVITSVGTTEGYTKWHILADFGQMMELDVVWSCGNPFYYSYGFDIRVRDIEESE